MNRSHRGSYNLDSQKDERTPILWSRRSDSSRRDQPPKRSRETSNRRSPPLMTDKRYPNAPLPASSRSHHRHYPSQRNTRVSSPSPSPPPPRSRYHRSSRPVAIKRPHSDSRSSSERRHAIHRSRPLPTDTPVPISASVSEDQSLSRKPPRISPSRDTGDLSFISEDESSKPTDVRVRSLLHYLSLDLSSSGF